MGNLWIEQATWPTNEEAVHIALIPKPTGGERPIGLFRSVVRVVCKAAAWDGLKWFEEQDITTAEHQERKENRRREVEGTGPIPDWHQEASW